MSPCSHIKFPDGTVAIVRHGRIVPPRCKFCERGRPATLLCDAIVGKTLGGDPITCDSPVCVDCAVRVGTENDFCPKHQHMK